MNIHDPHPGDNGDPRPDTPPATDSPAPAPTPDSAATPLRPPPELCAFLEALFEENDIILVRPVETWLQGKKIKKSRVLFKSITWPTRHRLAASGSLWRDLQQVASDEHANLFFGVAPRYGMDRFD